MNKKTKIKTIIIILLILAIALTLIILNVKKLNTEKQVSEKKQLTETSTDNAYVSMASHLAELEKTDTNIAYGINISDTSTTTFDIGFKPSKIIFTRSGASGGSSLSLIYDEDVSTTAFYIYKYNANMSSGAIGSGKNLEAITDTGFTVSSTMVSFKYSYIAIK